MTTGTELTDLQDRAPATIGGEATAVPVVGAPVWCRDPASWTVLLALLVWAVPFTRAGGGRDAWVLAYGLLALVPGLVVVRPWRVLSRLDLLALAPAACALLACFTAPTGFDGLSGFVSFTFAGITYLLVRGYLRGARLPVSRFGAAHGPSARARAGVVVATLVVAGADQFLQGWWAWYGHGDSSSLIVGTFFWHNQFAVFMAALGLLGAALAMRATDWCRWGGGVLAVLAIPSLAFAGSRATLALFVVGALVLVAVSLRRPRSLVTLAVLAILGLGLAAGLASPVLMSSSHSIAANVDGRESAVGNGQARLAFDRIALRLTGAHRLTGTGADSFGSVSAPMLPSSIQQPSAYVHNGFLQGFVDGGAPLGVAILVAALLPLAVGLRLAWRRRLGRGGDRFDAVSLGALGALGLLAAHSLVDFDWTYPSLVALYAVLGALVVRDAPAPAPDGITPDAATADDRDGDVVLDAAEVTEPGASPRSWFVPAFAVATVALLAIAVPASIRASAVVASTLPVPTWAKVASLGVPLADGPNWMRGAGECTDRIRLTLSGPSTDGLREDLACTKTLGASAPSVQIVRARAMARLGQLPAAEALADQLANDDGERIPQILVLRAALPADAGDTPSAIRAVRLVQSDPRVATSAPATQFAQSVLAELGGNA